MSKRPFDTQQGKFTRNDRFAQMSQQEKLIEEKKREIQAKLNAKLKTNNTETNSTTDTDTIISNTKTDCKSSTTLPKEDNKTDGVTNIFSNDGSFLDQFKQMKEKKTESKCKPFSKSNKDHDRNYNDNRNRWTPRRRSPSPKSKRQSRFSLEKNSGFEQQKITINTSFSSSHFGNLETHQNEQSKPINTSNELPLAQIHNQELVTFSQPNEGNFSVIATTPITQPVITAPPVLLNLQPPQIMQPNSTVSTFTVLPQTAQNVILTSVTVPTQQVITHSCLPLELASIPAPNPIQIQNIPQPEPLNTMNIPPPAPMQIHTIPTPSSLQLNEIPNPKPLDLMAIPTPNEQNLADANFLKNVPPPNKAVPPPALAEITVPQFIIQSTSTNPSQIPSLMAQPVLPPPGMAIGGMPVSCPPPLLTTTPSFVTRPPPITSQMPPMNVPPPGLSGYRDLNAVFPPGTPDFEAMSSLAKMVAECGHGVEQVVEEKKNRDPSLWFLFQKDSAAYAQYQCLVEQYTHENTTNRATPKPEDIYEPEMALEDELPMHGMNTHSEHSQSYENFQNESGGKRKRKSRWGEKDNNIEPPQVLFQNPMLPIVSNFSGGNQPAPLLSKVTRTDPGLLQYALNAYGSTNLTEEDWKKAEDNYKVHLLYQDMMRKREEVQRLEAQGRNKYEYDSDEDTEGGTWEHKLREKEMTATELWAEELNKQAEGKHHIGDFLPPEELKRFMEKSSAVKEGRQPNFSDYKEFKIKEDNIGFKMLQKLGWSEGEGLGSNNTGIVEPISKGAPRENTQGLGLNPSEVTEDEDEYDSYRKRMMLAYRFRPNPLNNPRRPYY